MKAHRDPNPVAIDPIDEHAAAEQTRFDQDTARREETIPSEFKLEETR